MLTYLNSPVPNLSRALNRSTEDAFTQVSLDLKRIYSQISARRKPVYNCVYCFKLRFRHLLACINEFSVLLLSGRDEFETGPLPKCTEFFLIDFRKSEPVSDFRLNRFSYRAAKVTNPSLTGSKVRAVNYN